MPQSACILVRIAVCVPPKPQIVPNEIDPIVCPHCSSTHYCRANDQPPLLLPRVTVEMAAFYRGHPDSN